MKISVRIMIFAAFIVLTFNQAAQASLLLEPYVGYVSGKQKQSTTSNYTGTEFGARVGYSTFGFAVGAEYAGTSLTDDSNPKNDLTGSDLGIFVAYKFPVLLRAYATYVPTSEIKDSSAGSTSTYKSGNSMKIGVGYTGFPFININLEYISGSYSKVESSGSTFSLDPNLTTSGYALSISMPFNLL